MHLIYFYWGLHQEWQFRRSTSLKIPRLQLFWVNLKVLGFKERVMYSWATMIWFTYFPKPLGKDNYLANKRNMDSETLAVIFFVSRGDTPNPWHLTTEPAEHNFGPMRVIIWYPKLHEMKYLVEKLNWSSNKCMNVNLLGQEA